MDVLIFREPSNPFSRNACQIHAGRGAMIGFNAEEDRRRHTVSENGVVVVALGEDPYVAAITEEALRLEHEADRRG